MSLIPKSPKDFSDPLYWKKFFEKHETAFEWYGDYCQLSNILEKYLKPSDSILQIGCGNSLLSEQLYDNGFRNVRSIDTDSKVIKRHKDNNLSKRPELIFECKSATESGMADGSVNVVLDKGTTDALLPSNFTPANQRLLADVFGEVERCLAPLGRFLIVTLAQQHIIRRIVDHFLPTRRALIRVQKCEYADDSFIMPVFVVVVTKLKMPLPHVPSLEFVRQMSAKVERAADCDALIQLIESEQELNWFKHYASKNIVEEATIKVCDQEGRSRYSLTIVDNFEAKILRTMAAFVVPLGREADWIFSTAKGRKILRKECARDRIIVVGLFRDQEYNSLGSIQTELGGLIVNLKPVGFLEEKIDFLSLGAIDVTESIAAGKSTVNGEWSVEQIKKNEKIFRRLIFLSSAGLVQSEVEMIDVKRRKNLKIKSDFLTCDHHRSMLTAINFVCAKSGVIDGSELKVAENKHLNLAVLGLGGGLFPRFLREKFAQASITTAEFDVDVLTIAQKYFGLPALSDKFKVVIDDAANFLSETSAKLESEKFEALFVDLAGPVQMDGLSCPPENFVTENSLIMMKNCLKECGVLAFNLVTRDEDKSREIKQRIREVFPALYIITSDEDVNEVLICPLRQYMDKPYSFNISDTKEFKDDWITCHTEELKKLCFANK